MGKLTKRDAHGSEKKCGGKVRGFYDLNSRDRFGIEIQRSGVYPQVGYLLSLSWAEARKIHDALAQYLAEVPEPTANTDSE